MPKLTSALAALLITLAPACAITHSPPDAAHAEDVTLNDASTEGSPDTAAPDAPSCMDADGDGFPAASCGGDDCDDSDPLVLPGTTRCASPTSVERCVDGELRIAECEATAPYCDAREGSCVVAEAACGDGVMHPGEACDAFPPSTMCDAECRLACDISSHCPTDQVCVDSEGLFGHCVPIRVGGLEDGATCASDDECMSAWCDPVQARCNVACSPVPRGCSDASAICASDPHVYPWTPGAPPPEDWFNGCEYLCGRDADCPSISVCTLHAAYPMGPPIMRATCLPRFGTGVTGSAPIGSACDDVLGCDSNTCLDGLCTRVCVDDGDCAAPLEHCADHDVSHQFSYGPGTLLARVCDP